MKRATLLFLVILTAPTASHLLGQMLVSVPARLVVEPTYPSSFSEELTFVFTNDVGGALAQVVVSESVKATQFRTGGRGMSGEVRLQKDGSFALMLPQGTYRMFVRMRSQGLAKRHFLKSVRLGETNILENLFTIRSQAADEFVVTLGECTAQTQEECK